MGFSANMRFIRDFNNITLTQMAADLGMSVTTITNYEKNKVKSPSKDKQERMAKYLGFTVEEMSRNSISPYPRSFLRAAELADRNITEKDIEKILRKELKPKSYDIIQMRYHCGMSREDIGKRLSITRSKIELIEIKAIRIVQNIYLDDNQKDMDEKLITDYITCNKCLYNRICKLQSIAPNITGCSGHSKSSKQYKKGN